MEKINWNLIFKVGVIGTSAAFFVLMLLEDLYGLPSFDGAMNLQVPKSLLESGKYMTTYDGGILFDGKIQTRMPVLLPILILWSIFGVHVSLAILVNIIYIYLLLFAVWIICKEVGGCKELGYCLLMLIVITPYFEEFALGIYGEIPTLALFLLSIVMLIKSEKSENKIRLYGFSGMFYSLACLNKTVILIAVPSFLFIFFIKLLWDKSVRIREIGIWFLAYLVPIALFEIFHLVQMGFDAYVNGWKSELLDIVQQAGVVEKYEDTPNIFVKFWTHINIFCEDFSFKPGAVIFVLFMCALFVYWAYRFFKKKEHSYYNIVFLVMCSYFGWWTIISTTAMAWPRRILIGVILLELVVIEDIQVYFNKKKNFILKNIVFMCMAVLFLLVTVNRCINIDRESKKEIENLSETIKEIDASEDATFYGFGWWQAPVVSFFSGVNFDNIENVSRLPENSYLVVDYYAKYLAQEELNGWLQKYHTELIDIQGDHYLYKISPLSVEKLEFSSVFDENDYSDVVKHTYEASEEYEYISGVYEYEEDNNSRWASPEVELLLNKKADSNTLNLRITVVGIENMTTAQPVLYVLLDNEIIQKVYLYSAGQLDVSIALPEEQLTAGVKDIRLFLDGKLINDNGDIRDLAYLLDSVCFSE